MQKYQNVDRYSHLYIKIYRVKRGNVIWLTIPTKLMMLKKCFGGHTSIHTSKNDFWTISMEAHLQCHITSPTIYEKHAQIQNIWKYQYEDRYSPLKLQICIKTIKKCTFHMPQNCWQMNYVEKICIGDTEHYMYCKNICGASQWNAFLMRFICPTMSLHPWSMPSIAVVSKFIINNIS